MNTGLLRYAVGTVLTVYGIETNEVAEVALKQLKDGWNSAYRLRY